MKKDLVKLYLRLEQLNYKKVSETSDMINPCEHNYTYMLLDMQDIINKDINLEEKHIKVIKKYLIEVDGYYYYKEGLIKPLKIDNDYYIKLCDDMLSRFK